MIRALLIDDEISALKAMSKKLEMYCSNIEVIAECNSAKEGLAQINALNPDLVFLDFDFEGTMMVFIEATLTLYKSSIAFLISILFAFLETTKLYCPKFSDRNSDFSEIIGFIKISFDIFY